MMGQNLILNMNDHGFTVVAYNRTTSKVDDFLQNEVMKILLICKSIHEAGSKDFLKGDFLSFFLFYVPYVIQHCFICRPLDSTVSEEAGNEPRTIATLALTASRSNHYARSHPHSAKSHPQMSKDFKTHEV